MYTAIKAVYNRKAKTYETQVIQDASPLAVHEGFMVFDSYERAIQGIQFGRLVPQWSDEKKACVLSWLRAQVVLTELGANV